MKNKIIMVALAAFMLLGAQLAQAKQNVYVFDMSALAGQNWELVGVAQDGSGNLLGTFDVAESGDQGSSVRVLLRGNILTVTLPKGETLDPVKGWVFFGSIDGPLLEPSAPGIYVYEDVENDIIGAFVAECP